MITRRGFLKRAGVTLAALGVGIKPLQQALEDKPRVIRGYGATIQIDNGSPLVLDNFGIAADSWGSLDYHEDMMFLAGDDNRFTTQSFREQQRPVLNMQKLDNAGVDTVDLRNAIADIESDEDFITGRGAGPPLGFVSSNATQSNRGNQ